MLITEKTENTYERETRKCSWGEALWLNCLNLTQITPVSFSWTFVGLQPLTPSITPSLPPHYPLGCSVNQPSNSPAFPVLRQRLDTLKHATLESMLAISALYRPLFSPSFAVWLLWSLVSSYTPAACLAIWRSLASNLPISVYIASLPALSRAPGASARLLVSVFRHVAELIE